MSAQGMSDPCPAARGLFDRCLDASGVSAPGLSYPVLASYGLSDSSLDARGLSEPYLGCLTLAWTRAGVCLMNF